MAIAHPEPMAQVSLNKEQISLYNSFRYLVESGSSKVRP